MKEYKAVARMASAEIVEKKSRFIANVFPVSDEDQAMEELEAVRKQYWDARHHCWAYVVGTELMAERCSDDGEPGGTAGKPILEVIKGAGVVNVFITVTRYFGGTLLGTGGLIRAYTEAARAGLAAAEMITRIYGFKLKIETNYTGLGKIQYILERRGVIIWNSEYTDRVTITVLVSETEAAGLRAEITEAANGQAGFEKMEECWFTKPSAAPKR